MTQGDPEKFDAEGQYAEQVEYERDRRQRNQRMMIHRRFSRLVSQRIRYAAHLYVSGADVATIAALIQDIGWYALPEQTYSNNLPEAEDAPLLLCSLRTALDGKRPRPAQIVPEAKYDSDAARVGFARLQYRLASVRGERWRHAPFRPQTFARDVLAITQYQETVIRVREYFWQGAVAKHLPDLCDWLLREAEHRGERAVEIVRAKLIDAWNQPDTPDYWPESVRRDILLSWLDLPVHHDWAEAELRKLLQVPLAEDNAPTQVEEAMRRATLYRRLGDEAQVATWRTRSLDLALGTGVDKDYQVSSWVEWVGRHNQIDPAGTAARLDLFARRLASAPQDRGCAFAATTLLEVTFDWSVPRMALLYRWLRENRTLGTAWALDKLLKRYADRANKDTTLPLLPALAVYKALLLTERYAGDEWPTVELLQVVAKRESDTLLPCARDLWEAARRECDEYHQEKVARDVAAVLNAYGLVPDTLTGLASAVKEVAGKSSTTDFPKPLLLNEDEGVPFTVVSERLGKDPALLPLWIEQERVALESYERFDWDEVIRQVAPSLPDIATIRRWRDVIASTKNDAAMSLSLAALGIRALQLGDRSLALQMGERALAASQPNGWTRSWDGGSRLAAWNLLVQIAPNKYREQAYRGFGDDIAANNGKNLAECFDDLLPIFGLDDQVADLDAEVESYAHRLFAALPVPDGRLDFLHEPLDVPDDAATGFSLLLLFHLRHSLSQYPTTERSAQALIDLTLTLPNVALPVLRHGLRASWQLQQAVLEICRTLASRNPEVVASLVTDIRLCATSSYPAVVRASQRVLALIEGTGESQ